MPGPAAALFDEVLEASVRPFWLLATGTGRCGTGYFAQVVSSVGVKCSHEGVFQPDPLEGTMEKLAVRLDPQNTWWGWEAESSWMAAPFLNLPVLRDIKVVHLIRHPKAVIDSQMRIKAFDGGHPKYRDFQVRYLPELDDLPPFHQAAHYYVKWNEMIEPWAEFRHRVDRDSILSLLDKLGIDWREKDVYSNTRYNSRRGWGNSDVDLESLPEPLRTELQRMTEGYGYEWPLPGRHRDRALRNEIHK